MDKPRIIGSGDFVQSERLLAIDTPLGPDTALLTGLEGEDALSRCFCYTITIATQQSDEAVQGLLGLPVTLWLQNHNAEQRRPISGHVSRLQGQGVSGRGVRHYRMEVVPRLWFLGCTSDCRIFQQLPVPDILQTVFTEHGLTDVEFRIIRADYPPVEYCVQHQETALNFVSRLMEHLGLFYWHEHAAGRHLLVIGDRNAATGMCQPQTVSLSPHEGTGELRSLEPDCSFRPGRWTLNDFDFEAPTKLLAVNAPTTLTVPRMVDHEMYEYPGHFTDRDTGRRLSRLRIELEEAQQRRMVGSGSCAGFDPGRRFLLDRGRSETPIRYLLTEVRHHATCPAFDAGGAPSGYSNDFIAIRAELPFRPERVTPKPFVRGAQTATVVGPAGEAIFCDQYGRVRVQFHWDRRGQRNDQSSCWMRVSQTRAGAYYGDLVIPHVGHEVIVSFLDGDPDRPLITGTVPNAQTMPPVALPQHKHKTVRRDHGDNKIVMHGKAGAEKMTMSSPRAVNVFASAQNARPLSAASQTFNGAPSMSSTAAGMKGASPTGVLYVIPNFQDGTGLQQLYNEWAGTTQSDIDNSGSLTTTTGTYGEQDGTVGDSYLNWGSEGRINCLTLGNNNNWCWGNLNTWVNGSTNTEVHGGSNSVIYAYSATTVLGDSTTTVVDNNNSFVFGDNNSFVLGLNTSFSIEALVTVNVGYALTVNKGFSTTFDLTEHVFESPNKTDTIAEWIVNVADETHFVGSSYFVSGPSLYFGGASLTHVGEAMSVAIDNVITVTSPSIMLNGAEIVLG